MSDRQLPLPEDVYQGLMAAAVMEGLSPERWIARHLPAPVPLQKTFDPELVADLLGSIDSRNQPPPSQPKTVFGEMLTEKMAKQGIHIP